MCGGGCRSLVLGRSASVRSIEDNRIEVTGAGNRPTQVHAFWYRERRDRIMVDVLRTIAYGDRCGADNCIVPQLVPVPAWNDMVIAAPPVLEMFQPHMLIVWLPLFATIRV